jgi:HEAT repeat protein
MLESSLVGVVKFAVRGLSGDDPRTRERLETALEHPAVSVQVLGLERLMATHRADVAPILHAVLTEPKWRELRDRKYEQILPFLVSLASEESLAPIASLLEDPNVEVRKVALMTLTRIRDTLKAKEEWEAIIRRQKPTPTGRVRPVPQGDSE